jgi:GTP-binding protein
LRVKSSRFERAVHRPEDEPKAPGPDVVFVGRSNVGKSSLINRLLGTKNLARTSSSPGRTQSVNFYRVNESCYFVDLPGYGWARVPEAVRRAWKPLVEGYLERRRPRIALALLIVDSRHEASELDLTMHEWLESKRIPYRVAATKSDKLNAAERRRAARVMLDGFGGGVGPPLLVSARSGDGIRELWRELDRALDGWSAASGATFETTGRVPD